MLTCPIDLLWQLVPSESHALSSSLLCLDLWRFRALFHASLLVRCSSSETHQKMIASEYTLKLAEQFARMLLRQDKVQSSGARTRI